MDCVAICAPRVGQEAALGRADPGRGVAEDAGRRDRAAPGLAGRGPGRPAGRVRGRLDRRVLRLGPASVHRPGDADVVRDLVRNHDTLVIPGTAFLPDDRRMLRVSAGRIDEAAAATLARRLTAAGR